MKICEWCGEEFDLQDTEEQFIIATGYPYENVKKCLCASCAIEAIDDEVDGVYFEECRECGKKFDLMEERSNFDSSFGYDNDLSLQDYWDGEPLCCDCTMAKKQETYSDC